MVPSDVFYHRIQTKRKARQYLRKNGRKFGTRCRSSRIDQTVGQRYRCNRCHYTFGDWTGRWLSQQDHSHPVAVDPEAL